MATTADISRGMIIKLDGSLYSIVEFGENKTARAADRFILWSGQGARGEFFFLRNLSRRFPL